MQSPRRSFLGSVTRLALFVLAAESAILAAPPRHKIPFFSKSSGFEHEVISYKKEQPSVVEKALTELGAKNGWDFTFSKEGSHFSPPAPAPAGKK